MPDGVIDRFWSHDYELLVTEALGEAPVLSDLRQGRVPAADPKIVLRRHYAEVRTALDLKLPSRIRLCPADAFTAKRFFWKLYAEEQGEFVGDANHANLFAVFCRSLGVTDDELETEFAGYWPNYTYLLTEQPSHAILVRELTISCVWESVILRLGPNYLEAIRTAFASTDDELRYFTVHETDDANHSVAALNVLKEYVYDETDIATVQATIRDTLVLKNPWTLEPSAKAV